MKVKIRGLVFVGFAAAVFAQSAMADANDAKTVTSKLYVDTTFQTLDNITTTSELTVGNGVTEQMVNAHWASNSEYPSMAVLNEVKSQVTGIDVNGDETYINVADNAGTFTVSPKLTPATANSEITGTLTETNGDTVGTKYKLVTAGAVKSLMDTGLSDAANAENDTTVPTSLAVVSYAEKKANKATSITTGDGGNSTSDTAYPTTKAVYDFVTTQGGAFQPKVTDTGDNLKVGYLGSGTGATPTWKTIKGASTGTGSTTDYVTINQDGTSGVYEVNLDGAQLAAAATGLLNANSTSGAVTALTSTEQVKLVEAGAVEGLIAYESSVGTTTISDAVSGNGKVPTVKNVYDFVNGNYQAKAATGANTIEVGHNGAWANLVGDSTYTNVAMDGNNAKVSLTNLTAHGVSDTGATPAYTSDFAASGDSRTKLARAGDVYDFVMDQTGGLAIPEMPDECDDAAEAGGYCALVYGLISSGTSGQAGVTYGLQWTVMAPVPTTGGE